MTSAPQDVHLPDPDARVIGAPQGVPPGWVLVHHPLSDAEGLYHSGLRVLVMSPNERHGPGSTVIFAPDQMEVRETPAELARLLSEATYPPAATPALTEGDAQSIGPLKDEIAALREENKRIKKALADNQGHARQFDADDYDLGKKDAEIAALRAEVAGLRETFRHEPETDDIGRCVTCGLDVDDAVHAPRRAAGRRLR